MFASCNILGGLNLHINFFVAFGVEKGYELVYLGQMLLKNLLREYLFICGQTRCCEQKLFRSDFTSCLVSNYL
jgi:hypothetical protein